MFRTISAVVVSVAVLVTGSALFAQEKQASAGQAPGAPPKPFHQYDVMQMARWDLDYGNEKDWEEAIGYLAQLCEEKLDPTKAPWRDENWRGYVVEQLFYALEKRYAAGNYELCDRAAGYGVILATTRMPKLEWFMEMRINAKLKLGKHKEALALAKSYYNVCSMPKTSDAIDLLCVSIMADHANPDAAATARKLRMQQVQGTTPPAQTAESSAAKAASVLDGVTVDAEEYLKTAKQLAGRKEAYGVLIDRGNLLLLADKPADAKALFDKAYALATDKQLAEATEAVARAMRAEDRAVGRANAWILSLRAK